jgi:hypothetical protein
MENQQGQAESDGTEENKIFLEGHLVVPAEKNKQQGDHQTIKQPLSPNDQ